MKSQCRPNWRFERCINFRHVWRFPTLYLTFKKGEENYSNQAHIVHFRLVSIDFSCGIWIAKLLDLNRTDTYCTDVVGTLTNLSLNNNLSVFSFSASTCLLDILKKFYNHFVIATLHMSSILCSYNNQPSSKQRHNMLTKCWAGLFVL